MTFVRCPKCNKLVPSSAAVCGICGTRMNNSVSGVTQTPPTAVGASSGTKVQGFPSVTNTAAMGFPSVTDTANMGFPAVTDADNMGFPPVVPSSNQVAVQPSKSKSGKKSSLSNISLSSINLGGEWAFRICGILLSFMSLIFLILAFSRFWEFSNAHEKYWESQTDEVEVVDEVLGPWSSTVGSNDALGNWAEYANALGESVTMENIGVALTSLTDGVYANVGGFRYYMVVVRSDNFYANGAIIDPGFDTSLLQSALYVTSALTHNDGGNPVVVYIYANASNMEYDRVKSLIVSGLPSKTPSVSVSAALIAEQLGHFYNVPVTVFVLLYLLIVLHIICILAGIILGVMGEDVEKVRYLSLGSLVLSGIWGAVAIFALVLLVMFKLSLVSAIVVSVLSALLLVACTYMGRVRARVYFS